MRKKYLSALLFGALLFASAGTFTSCKDYDDDIKDLQEQINTVKTSLDELSGKLNSLGAGITDFKYEGGKLVLSTDKNTKFEVELPADKVGITSVEVKDGYLWIDGVKGDAIAVEGEAIEVEVKDGILYINGKAQDLKDEVGSTVVMVDNNNGTYTLTVDGTSYVLPKASAAVSILVTKDLYFTNLSHGVQDASGGIVWGTADSYRGNWKGLKSVEKGKLLVGHVSTVGIRVSPATFDLTKSKLTLVNTLGEEAQVNVIPVAEGKKGPAIGEGSRAADANGVWDLMIEMKSSVTAENINTIFAAKDANNDYKNVKYALAVDGKVATDYVYFVDTNEKKDPSLSFNEKGTTQLSFKENGVVKDVVTLSNNSNPTPNVNVPLGETTLFLTAVNSSEIDKVYDSYIEIVDQDLADDKGITVNGMTITASDKAAALEGFKVNVHFLDVNGNESKVENVAINFAASKVAGQELGDQIYTVLPSADTNKQFILIDLKDVFTSLSADEAVKVSTNAGAGTVTFYTTSNDIDNKLFNTSTESQVNGLKKIDISTNNNGTYKILFYKTKEEALAHGLKYDKDVAITFNGTTADVDAPTIRKIGYAVLSYETIKNDAMPNASTPLTIILKDKEGNEIRKAAGTYTVTLPAFDDVLEANNNKVWKENTFYTRVSTTNGDDALIKLEKPFKSKFSEGQVGYLPLNDADNRLSYELKYTDFSKENQYVSVSGAKPTNLKGIIVNDDDKTKIVNDIDVVATLDVLGKGYENFKVTKEFKVYLQSIFEGAELAYYYDNDDVLKKGALTLGDYKYVYGGQLDKAKKYGLFIKYNGEEQPYVFDTNIKFTTGNEIGFGGISMDKPNSFKKPNLPLNAYSHIYGNEGAVGTLTLSPNKVQPNDPKYGSGEKTAIIVKLDDQNSGELIFTLVDKMGVEVDMKLPYKK